MAGPSPRGLELERLGGRRVGAQLERPGSDVLGRGFVDQDAELDRADGVGPRK